MSACYSANKMQSETADIVPGAVN